MLDETGLDKIRVECGYHISGHAARLVESDNAATCPVPTIGIGALKTCDSQALVTKDIFGLHKELTTKFVEQFADLQIDLSVTTAAFQVSVFKETFPLEQHLLWPKQ